MTFTRRLPEILLVLALATPTLAATAPDVAPTVTVAPRTGRFILALRHGGLVGLKVYAMGKGTRLERAGLRNGDTIEAIDGARVTHRLDGQKILAARADVVLEVRRAGQLVRVTIPAPR